MPQKFGGLPLFRTLCLQARRQRISLLDIRAYHALTRVPLSSRCKVLSTLRQDHGVAVQSSVAQFYRNSRIDKLSRAARELCRSYSKSSSSAAQFSIFTASPENVLQALSKWDVSTKLRAFEKPLVVLLVTPNFAHLLHDGDRLLDYLPRSLLKRLEPGAQFDVLVAVVDAIPVPAQKGNSPTQQRSDSSEGAEGLSAYVSSSGHDSASLVDSDPTASSLGAEVEAKLSFSLTTNGTEASNSHQSHSSYLITISLPNTIFQNGLPHTLKTFCYEIPTKRSVDETAHLKLVSSRQLDHCTIKLDIPPNSRLDSSRLALKQMAPLTQYRRISDSMGNVLRRLEDPGSETGVIPASRDLETRLKQAKTRPFEIWAEIVPLERAHDLPNATEHLSLSDILDRGHRFSRVLSGGGGWGSRAGLLSLDSASIPTDRSVNDESSTTAYEIAHAVPNLVRKGDLVRFHVVNGPSSSNSFEGEQILDVSSSAEGQTALQPIWEFGTSIREDDSDLPTTTRVQRELGIAHSFGALSIRPATVQVTRTPGSDAAEADATSAVGRAVWTHLPPRCRLMFSVKD